MRGMGWAGRCMCWRRGGRLIRRWTLDPSSVEANLYRVYMLLSRGEKESARHGIEHLLQTAENDWNVHLVAGMTLRIDGMYEDALDQFNTSLRLNPSNAAVIYNHRARVYQYQNQLELAADEIEKGLTLEPRQPLLRISLGYQQMREGQLGAGGRDAGERDPATMLRCASCFRRLRCATCRWASGRGRRSSFWKRRCRRRKRTARWLTGWRRTLRWKAMRPKRCTGCGGRSIWAMRIIRGSARIRRGGGCRRIADFQRILEDLKKSYQAEPEELEDGCWRR